MVSAIRTRRGAAAGLATLLVIVVATSGCGSTASSGSSSASSGTYTVWDPYPQFDNGSAWTRLLDTCGSAAGVRVKRTAFDTTDLSKVLSAAQQGVAPDVLIVDNPVISTLAQAGVLTDTATTKVDTTAVEPNLLAAVQAALSGSASPQSAVRAADGQRDRAYTWTASSYLILAAAAERRRASPR